MIKRAWPPWLNGGVFAVIVFLVVSIISVIYLIILDTANTSVLTDSQFLTTGLLEIILYFLVGSIVGQLFGKIKSKK